MESRDGMLDRACGLVECCSVEHLIDFDRDNQWAVIRYRGVVEIEDALALMRQLVAMPGWTPRCDRIVVYDDGLLGRIKPEDFRRMRQSLVDFIAEHYGDTPSFSAQVCGNPVQRPLVEYWVNLGRDAYLPRLEIFNSVRSAKAWLKEQRAALEGG